MFWVNAGNADLRRASLAGADCCGANFSRANLRNARLEGGAFLDAVFDDADLTFARIGDMSRTSMVGARR